MGIRRFGKRDEFTFEVRKLWDGRVDDIVSGADNVSVAIAAFEAQIKNEPDREFILCQGGRVLKKHPADLVIR